MFMFFNNATLAERIPEKRKGRPSACAGAAL